MDLKNWYDRVREQLDRLDFPALWAGFAPCPFALYTHDTAVLNGEMMPRPAEFYGNTSVCRQGEYLAIWDMEADPPADAAGLAASLVHEMFHSFQCRCGEQGWPDDLVLAATEPQPAFLALRAQEHRALAGGAPLSEVLALRQSRAALQPELLLEGAHGDHRRNGGICRPPCVGAPVVCGLQRCLCPQCAAAAAVAGPAPRGL